MTEKRGKKGPAGKDLLSFEQGPVVRAWRGRIPVCVVYPNSYYIGMSSLATHMLYDRLNDSDEFVCERSFFEPHEPLRSLETGRPLGDFEILFFPLSFELDYPNIPRILEESGIPLPARSRRSGDPLIVAGGICVMANPEPLAGLFDFFIMGDIEAVIPPFMSRFLEAREEGGGREGLVEALSGFEWVYNPRHLDVRYGEDGRINAFVPPDYSVTIKWHRGKDLGVSSILSSKTEFADMLLVEGTRGCPSVCPFCLMGTTYPLRYDPLQEIETDADHIGILGGGVSFHPRLAEIIADFHRKGKRVHLPSLRIDEVPIEVLGMIAPDIKTLTFGVEAGTERMRAFLGKALTDDALLGKIDAILAIKPFNLKVYFMIGLPGETMADVEAIVDLTRRIHHRMVKSGAPKGAVGSITVHVSPFVPKAATPFQWLPMDDMATLTAKITWLKKALSPVDNTYFTNESVKFSFIQGILARGDRRTAEMIVRLSAGETVQKLLRDYPVNPNFYVLRERPEDEIFPWDFIRRSQSGQRLYGKLGTYLATLR